jgi:integrase
MAKTSHPKHCIHRGIGQSYVRINGRQIFTGTLVKGKITADAEKAYRRIIVEYLANQDKPVQAESISIDELILRFFKQKLPTVHKASAQHFKAVSDTLLSHYAGYKAVDISVREMRTVRALFIEKGWKRSYVNDQTARIRQILIWGQQEGILPQQYNPPKIKALEKGECICPEGVSRKTIPLADIEKTIAALSPTLAAAVKIQLATAARPSEVLEMRIEQINRSNPDCWEVRYIRHKTAKKTGDKTIFLAKPEIAVITPYIGNRAEGYVFTPESALADRKAKETAVLKSKYRSPSAREKAAYRKRHPKQKINDHYDVAAYRRAITRACERAGVPHWFPYGLRHTGVTLIGLEHGIEAAQHIAGHRNIATTEHYFHGQDEIARRITLSRNQPSTTLPIPAADTSIMGFLAEQNKIQAQQIAALTELLQKKGYCTG